MAHVNARQWQRFSYRADVQLCWAAPQCESDVQGAVCVNLGRGGMQVRTEVAPEVGAAVSCKLWFAGDWTTLPGRVRWTRADAHAEPSNELGIEFGPLSAEQDDSIGELVASAEHGGRHVKLRVPGLRDPLEALAVPTDRGLRLRAPVRLFAAGSELDVELPDASLRFTGRVLGSQLRSRAGSECWELELLIEEHEAPRSRRYTMHGAPGAPTGSASPERKKRLRAETLLLHRPGAFQRARWLMAVGIFALAAIGSAGWLSATPRRPSQHLAKPAQRLPPLAAKTHTASVASARKAPASDGALLATPASAAARHEVENTAQAKSRAELDAAAIHYVADEPMLEIAGDTTHIFVPVRGTLERMHTALWVEPLALVVDLPDTEITLARSRYVLRAGGVTVLSVGTNHGVTQLRLFLDAVLARYGVQAVPGGLAIQLKRDLRPMP